MARLWKVTRRRVTGRERIGDGLALKTPSPAICEQRTRPFRLVQLLNVTLRSNVPASLTRTANVVGKENAGGVVNSPRSRMRPSFVPGTDRARRLTPFTVRSPSGISRTPMPSGKSRPSSVISGGWGLPPTNENDRRRADRARRWHPAHDALANAGGAGRA
jgi:hypothetical protein